ncbi:MAG: Tyr recombinase protein [Euryarchaeota archaeon]|nr:Tyr recombinase protein [Euryarchaeota archaeon]
MYKIKGGFKIEFVDIAKDPLVIEWFETINARPKTIRNYTQGLRWFTEFTGKTPDELLQEAEQEIRDGLLMRHRNVKKYLIGFRQYLQEKENSPNTVRTHIQGAKSFYSAFDIELPKLSNRAGHKAQALRKHKIIPTKEDIQEVLKVADPLEKALVLTGCTSGLSANEICNLTVGEFNRGYDKETGITTLPLRREKEDFDFITFLSPEASKAILDYLAYRERKAKTTEQRRLDQLEKQRVFAESNYLFIKRYIPLQYMQTRDEDLRKLDLDSMVKIYHNLSDKAMKNAPKGDWNLIRSHNMRKYFYSALRNAGCDTFHAEFFMGHTLPDSQSPYFDPKPEKLREIYQNYVPYLTIQKELNVSESPEFQKLKTENEVLAREAVRATVERSEIQKLRDEIEQIKELTDESNFLLQLMRESPEAIEIMKNLKK